MERANKTERLNPVAKLHIIYGSVIVFMSLAFIITLTTMNSTYKNMLGQMSANGGAPVAAGQIPENHPDVGGQAQPADAASGGMPAAGGMPPFLKKMLDTYKTALAKNPNDVEALTGLGNMYYDSGQYPKAIDYYEKILVVDPKNSNVRADLGTCYFYSNIPDKAIKNLTIALEANPSNVNARYNLGIVYKTQGKVSEARKQWEAMKPYLKTEEEKQKLQSVIDQLNKSAS
jgi:tetratricopeptide (TPR) repeat protein